MTAQTQGDASAAVRVQKSLARVAVAVDPHLESHDAALLAMAIARATGAEMTLLAIEPDLPTGVPGFDWRQVRRQTGTMVAQARD